MKSNCILFILWLLIPAICFAQTTEDNPVANDPFFATAGVSIPLVTRKMDGIDIGVSLGYSTAGIRLDQIASEIGLGWNLNTGGGISRSIKGLPDELFFHYSVNQPKTYRGYWQRSNSSVFGNINQAVTDLQCAQTADAEMDEFNLSLPGLQLTFFINNNNEIITKPNNSRVKIKRIINSTMANFPTPQNVSDPNDFVTDFSFEVIDEGGNVFRLESGEQTEAKLNGGYVTLNFTTRWVLKQIQTYNGKIADYHYLPATTIQYEAGVSEEALDGANDCFLDDFTYHIIKQKNLVRYIDRIEFPDVKILFFYDNNNSRQDIQSAKCLKQVHVVEKENILNWGAPNLSNVTTIKKIQFEHSYFSIHGRQSYPNPPLLGTALYGEENYDSENFRLCLDKVQQVVGVQGNQTTRNLYEFSYFDVSYPASGAIPARIGDIPINLSPGYEYTLPYRLNPCQDFWGYYNGNGTDGSGATPSGYTPSMIPKVPNPSNLNSYGVAREANANNRLFALKRIKNEGNGITEISYGLNQVAIGGVNFVLDGLRLDRISSYTDGLQSNTTTHITDYVYENGEWILPAAIPPAILTLFSKSLDLECKHVTGVGINTVLQNGKTSYSNQMLACAPGTQHGYGKVTTYTKKQYAEKVNGVSQSIFETTGWTETHYATMNNLPQQFEVLGNVYAGTPANLLLPILQPDPGSNYSILASNYRRGYNSIPYSSKVYFLDWVLGVPYLTRQFDKFGNKMIESEQQYSVYVNNINLDHSLNLKIGSTVLGKENSGPATPYLPELYCTADKYALDFYHPITGRLELKSNSVKTYQNSTNFLEKRLEYTYDPSTGYPRKTTEIFPNNVVVEQRQYYSSDNNDWNANAVMFSLTNANKIKVIHSETWRQEPGQAFKLFNASGGGYAMVQGKVLSTNSYHLIGSSPLITSPISTNMFTVSDANLGNSIPNFEKGRVNTKFDPLGNTVETMEKSKYNSSIYDFYQDELLAVVSNSRYDEMAYNSFESNIYRTDYSAPDFEQDKGNWHFFTQGLKRGNGITGKNCYNLSATYDDVANNVMNIPVEIKSASNVQLIQGKKYIISFWRKQGSNVAITNFDLNPATGASIPFTTYLTNVSTISSLNGWTFCQAEFVAQFARIRITGDALIDELRLYPANASMVTSCFTPVYGKMSECDAGNNIQHFEYDEGQRVHIQRDVKGNIRSKTRAAKQAID